MVIFNIRFPTTLQFLVLVSGRTGPWFMWLSLSFHFCLLSHIYPFRIYWGISLLRLMRCGLPSIVISITRHSLHHIIHADIYNANIPSPYDYYNSNTLKEHDEKLKSISLFVKHFAFSDCVGLALVIFCGIIMHQAVGVSVKSIDWDEVIWHSHHISAF